jgi:TolB-like protein/DNA-binding winged helix-turn-helix (wHTH) protein/Flp pilus assembly protein TadD
MATAPASKSVLRFGVFELDAATGEVRKHGLLLKLHPQPTKVLILLASRANQLVTREEIKNALWGQDTFVDFEQGLNSCIRQIRGALGDDPDNPRFVQTIPRKGYRFIAPVASGNGIPSAAAAVPVPVLPLRRTPMRGKAVLFAGAVVLVLTTLAAMYFVSRRASAARPATKIMLAVLPFQNYSPDAEREYLADGLTEEMITQLGSMEPERLGVIARTSAMKYKGAHAAVDQIGKELGVDYVLEGSIRTEGDRVRVTAQLIRVKDQTHVWARSYERTHGGILTMQQEVANAIAAEIQVELTPQYHERLAALQFANPRAHEAYARGRFFWNKRTDADLVTAIQYFEEVLRYEPRYALAYSGLADAYFYRSYAWGSIPPKEGMPKARAAAMKALELDPNSAEAHTSMAVVKFFYDWDWPGAEAEFKRAIELNPNYPTAHHGYAVLLLTAYGRWDDAIDEANRALAMDPLSVPLNNIVALILLHSPRHDETIERSKKLHELNQGMAEPYAYMSAAFEHKGSFGDAVEMSLKQHALAGSSEQDLVRLKDAYARGGIAGYRRMEAEITIAMATQQPPQTVLGRLALASANAHIGNNGAALDILERICDERSGMAVWTKIDFAQTPGMTSDPRFQALLRRIGLP